MAGARRGSPVTGRFTRALVLVLLLAGAVRIGSTLATKQGAPPRGDGIFYSLEAVQLAHGLGFTEPFTGRPAADHPPLVALSLVPAAWLFDDSLMAMRLTGAVLGTAAVALIALLARRLAGDAAGIAAGVVAALHPGLWVNDATLMGESLTALLTAAVLLAALALRQSPSRRKALLAGLLVGAAVMVRAELALLWVVAVVPALVGAPLGRRARLTAGALSVGAVLLVVAPWTLYNATRFTNPVLVSTNDGLTLAGANCDATYYGRAIGFWSYDCATANPPQGDQSVVAAALRHRGLDYATSHLTRVPIVVGARVARVWSLGWVSDMVAVNQNEGREPWASWAAFAGFWLLMPLGIAGARRLRAAGESIVAFVLLAVEVTVVAMAFNGIVRQRLPFEVGLTVLAGIALAGAARPGTALAEAARPGTALAGIGPARVGTGGVGPAGIGAHEAEPAGSQRPQ